MDDRPQATSRSERQAGYLRALQEKNRHKKLNQAKTREEQLNEERERGFQLNWAGANEERAKRDQDIKDRRRSGGVALFRHPLSPGEDASIAAGGSASGAPRRQWDAPLQFIRGARGPVKAQHPGYGGFEPDFDGNETVQTREFYYDHDFEADDDEPENNSQVVEQFLQSIGSSAEMDALRRSLEFTLSPSKQHAQDDKAGDELTSETNESEEGHSPKAVKQQGSDGAVDASQPKLAPNLLHQIQNLNADQQLQLLQILQKMTSVPPEHHESNLVSQEHQNADPEQNARNRGARHTGEPTEMRDDSAMQPPSIARELKPTPPHQPQDSTTLGSSEQVGLELDSKSGALASVVKVRIRMTSTWDGGKIGSLRRVAFYVESKGERRWIPMDSCQPRVQSGIEMFSSGADEARSLMTLLHATAASPREVWKGPVSRSAPLQILVDIPISVMRATISAYTEGTPFVLAVDIWNADDGHAALAIRDVDVFANSRCCWSGELPKRTPDEQPCTVTLLTEPDEAASVQPIPKRLQASSQVSAAGDEADNVRNASGSTVKETETSWMIEIDQASRKTTQSALDADTITERPPSGRTRSRRQRQREMVEAALEESVNATAPAPPSAVHGVQPEQKAPAAALTVSIPEKPRTDTLPASTQSGSPLSKFVAVNEEDASRKKATEMGSEWGVRPWRSQGGRGQSSGKGDDDKLRSSLEAIRKSDRQPRGRLAALGISFFSRSKQENVLPEVEPAQELETSQQSTPGDILGTQPAAPDVTATEARDNNRRVQQLSENATREPVADGETQAGPAAQGGEEPSTQLHVKKEALETRARKIGKVKREVENALAGLAGVIGQINQKKDRVDPSSSPKDEQSGDTPTKQQHEPEDVLEASTVTIPELPSGRVFRMDILSTWGDPFYVGLNGIEIFDQDGQLVRLEDRSSQIIAHPADINVLPEYDGDPRVKENLFDGINYTCDDLHMWLAPYNAGEDHYVMVDFHTPTTLSMIRIWNYNKSRTHAYRGVRVVRLSLDDRVIFEGEILMASGVLDGVENCSEVILFTLDADVMRAISKFDEQREYLSEDRTTQWTETAFTTLTSTRPATAASHETAKPESVNGRMWKRKARTERPRITYEEAVSGKTPLHRPLTAARTTHAFRDSDKKSSLAQLPDTIDELLNMERSPEQEYPANISPAGNYGATSCSVIELVIHSTWGDVDYVGLTGIQIIGKDGDVLPIKPQQITTIPKDLSDIGVRNDPRVSANLVDNVNDTTDDTHMWLAPFNQGDDHLVRINLGRATEVAGLRIWNYNKSPEDSYRGGKNMEVRVDNRLLGSCVLRIAPGMDGLNLGQLILFDRIKEASAPPERTRNYVSPSVRQDYETQMLPTGLLWQFIFHSTWGDPYYIGLDGLEIFDRTGAQISLTPMQLSALPYSLRDINQDDSRVPANLASREGPWLAPLANTMTADEQKASVIRCSQEYAKLTQSLVPPVHSRLTTPAENMLFVALDQAESLSFVRLYNYSKTPERGVKEISIRCDGKLVFRGTVSKASVDNQPPRGQAILFTNDPRIVQKEKEFVSYCGRTEQDVLCIDERQVKVRSQAMYSKPDPTAPGVQTDVTMRPDTALR